MAAEGIELRHITRGCNVPMYRTSIATHRAGPFHGPMVVSMRPMTPRDAIRAVQITTRFPSVHGAPVHIGKPELIGIADVNKPDYGDVVPVRDDELRSLLGLWSDAAIGHRDRETGILHHPLSGQHARDGSQEYRIRDPVRDTTAFQSSCPALCRASRSVGHSIASLSEMAARPG